MEDLCAAAFRAVLLAVPAGVLLVGAAWLYLDRGATERWREILVAGICLGLGLVWSLSMVRVESSGCTGVSQIYEATLLITWACLFLFGPWVAELARCRSARPRRPAHPRSPGRAPRIGRKAPWGTGGG